MLISNKACSGTVCARAGNPGATLIQDFSGFLLEVFVVSVIALTRFSGIYLALTTEFFSIDLLTGGLCHRSTKVSGFHWACFVLFES